MKTKWLFIIFFVLLSCSKDELRPGGIETDQFKDCVLPSLGEGIFIINVERDSSFADLRIFQDNGDTSIIPGKCVSAFKYNYESWQVDFTFHDSTIQSIPFKLVNPDVIKIDTVILNPFDTAPLSALLKFTTAFPARIKISVKQKSYRNAKISQIFNDPAIVHEIPVFGLFPNFENTLILDIIDNNGEVKLTKEISILTQGTGTLRSGKMNVIQNNFSTDQQNRLFLIQNAIYDGAGDVRWVTNISGQNYYRLSEGKIAIQTYPDRGYLGPGPDIRIINFLGEVIDTFDVPHRMHHEISEKTPGGNLLVASNVNKYLSIEDDTEDLIIEIDRNSGSIVKEWNLREIFDMNRQRLWTEKVNDWCHLNSIQFDSTDNSLLISSKLQYFISKIDYDTGEIKWILGNHENWKESWQEHLLTPVNFDSTLSNDYDWTYAQHMPRLTNDGNVMVYDNGASRPGGSFTRAVEFSVDELNMTVKKEWSYDLTTTAKIVGSVNTYPDGSVQIGHGNNGQIYEVNRAGDILFEGKLYSFYRSYPIESFYNN
jgi:arylsulfate sulfotransferase